MKSKVIATPTFKAYSVALSHLIETEREKSEFLIYWDKYKDTTGIKVIERENDEVSISIVDMKVDDTSELLLLPESETRMVLDVRSKSELMYYITEFFLDSETYWASGAPLSANEILSELDGPDNFPLRLVYDELTGLLRVEMEIEQRIEPLPLF